MASKDTLAPTLSQLDLEGIQVGRQPILDRKLRVYGYELLYRDAGMGPGDLPGDQATSRTLLNTLMDIGLEHIAGHHKAFINLTRTFITQDTPLPLSPEQAVLEILEDIQVDPSLLDGLGALRDQGFTLALDDYRFEPHWDPVLPLVSMVKVDILGLDLEGHADKIAALRELGLTLLAEKVETQQQFEQCRDLGFDLFQGYFFAKPNIISGHRLAENQTVMLRMLAQINDPACTVNELEPLIAQDAALSFKLLRYINSAGTGLARQVESIRQAVVLAGLNRIRAWATLFIMSARQDKPTELLTNALVRAHLCETLSRTLGAGNPDSAYAVGLLSALDALLDQPMNELVAQLPLPQEITDALLHQQGTYGRQLSCALALEAFDWLSPEARLLPIHVLNMQLIDAMEQAEAIKQSFL